MYKIWLKATGSGEISFTDDTAMTATIDYKQAYPVGDYGNIFTYCSSTPNLSFEIEGSCEVNQGCFTTANFFAWQYAYKSSSSSTDCSDASGSAWAIKRASEAFGISSYDLNGDMTGRGTAEFKSLQFGQSTYITRGNSPASEKLYYEISGSVLSTYQMCFSSSPVVLSGMLPVDNTTLKCDYGCSPNSDCTPNDMPGLDSDDLSIDADEFYASVMIIVNAADSEHFVAYSWGHPPTGAAASLAPGLAIIAAAIAMM